MNIRGARQSLSMELLTNESNVVAVGLTERSGRAALTVLLDGPADTEIPDVYEGFPVYVMQSGAFYADPSHEAREVA